MQPDFATQCQCKPNAERRELALKSYAEVQPDFATQCQCKPNAELENSFSKVMLRCSLTSRMQRYNLNTPKSKFFRHLISHPYFFKQLYKAPNPFIYKHFRTFFKREKKWNRDIPFYRIPISKTYVTRAFPYSISTESLPWPVPWGFVKNRCLFPLLFNYWVSDSICAV